MKTSWVVWKVAQSWDTPYHNEKQKKHIGRVSLFTNPPNVYFNLRLLVVQDVDVVNQLLIFSIKVQTFSVPQQVKEGCEACIGFDGVWLVLFRAWGVWVS